MLSTSFFTNLEIRYDKTSEISIDEIETDIEKFTLNSCDSSKWININSFLNATKAFLPFFDLLGAPYRIVKSDMMGNISKIEEAVKYTSYVNFYQLLKDEQCRGTSLQDKSATVSLTWLLRALKFVEHFLSGICASDPERVSEDVSPNDYEDLKSIATSAYKTCLLPHHSWIIQKLFSVISRVIPSRSELFNLLSPGVTDPVLVYGEINEFLSLLSPNIKEIEYIYELLNQSKIDNEK